MDNTTSSYPIVSDRLWPNGSPGGVTDKKKRKRIAAVSINVVPFLQVVCARRVPSTCRLHRTSRSLVLIACRDPLRWRGWRVLCDALLFRSGPQRVKTTRLCNFETEKCPTGHVPSGRWRKRGDWLNPSCVPLSVSWICLATISLPCPTSSHPRVAQTLEFAIFDARCSVFPNIVLRIHMN